MKTYDTIIIGAGHNGLVCAATLAKAGQRVLVLEARPEIGGICASETLAEGLQVESVVSGGGLRADISRSLGLDPARVGQKLTSLLPDGGRLSLSSDVNETTAEIRRFSKSDALRWAEFAAFMDKAAGFLETAYRTPMPRLPVFPAADGLQLAQLGLKLRGLGPKDMYGVIRMLPMTAREFLDEWFETDALKAAIATLGIHNANLGVMSAGSAFNLLHQYLIRAGWGQAQTPGGVGQIPARLSASAKDHGAEIRCGARVAHIQAANGQVSAVTLESGEQILAQRVVSATDPKRTLLELLPPEHLDPELAWQAGNIKLRGVTARLHLLLDAPLDLPNGTMVIAPGLNMLEKAYDAAKYGQISERPFIELHARANTLSAQVQFAPYHLRGASWQDGARQVLETRALAILEEFIPGLGSRIRKQVSITPLELEKVYGLNEGDPQHGQIMLDQFLFMRPLPGWSDYEMPVRGLYLCGAGTHGGGGVSGIPGRNAARKILKG